MHPFPSRLKSQEFHSEIGCQAPAISPRNHSKESQSDSKAWQVQCHWYIDYLGDNFHVDEARQLLWHLSHGWLPFERTEPRNLSVVQQQCNGRPREWKVIIKVVYETAIRIASELRLQRDQDLIGGMSDLRIRMSWRQFKPVKIQKVFETNKIPSKSTFCLKLLHRKYEHRFSEVKPWTETPIYQIHQCHLQHEVGLHCNQRKLKS